MLYTSAIISVIIIFLPLLIVGNFALIGIFSFYVLASILIFMLWRLIFFKRVGISFIIIFIFFLLFFYIAPILQLYKDSEFLVNTVRVEELQILVVNGMNFIFLFFYNLFYFRKNYEKKALLALGNGATQAIFPAFFIFSIIISAWAISEVDLVRLIIIDVPEDNDLIMSLIKNKLIFLLPFFTFALYLNNNLRNRSFVIAMCLLLLVILTKNPLFDRRNSLGPVYLTLICIAFPYFIATTRNFFIFIFTILVVAFPASSIFTHRDPFTWVEVLSTELIFEEIIGHFTDMHYDAWSNFVGAVDYVEKTGHNYGLQMLGSLLFYVPRSFWPEKPISSGQLLGEYLSRNYQLWFENISFPFPAEGYIDFGLLGVILFAIGLAWYSRRLDFFVSKRGDTINQISSIYFSIFLLFVLRGSLLPAVAYGVSAYLAINVLPFILSFLLPRKRDIAKNIRVLAKN